MVQREAFNEAHEMSKALSKSEAGGIVAEKEWWLCFTQRVSSPPSLGTSCQLPTPQ